MQNGSILLVKQHTSSNQELEESLTEIGYRLSAVVESIQTVSEYVSGNPPCAVLVDCEEIEKSFLKQVLDIQKKRQFPVVLLFDSDADDLESLVQNSRTVSYLFKPIRTKDLGAAIGLAKAAISECKPASFKTQSKEELDSAYRLAAHLKATPLGVIEFNNNFEVITWNNGAEKIFGYSEAEAIGRSTFDILVPEHEVDRVSAVHLWEDAEVSEHINENKTKSGVVITCQWFNAPIRNEDGEVVGLTAVCQDITEQIKTKMAWEQRLLALTQPLEDTGTVLFEELFKLEDIQELQDRFAKAAGVASIITRTDGTHITKPSNAHSFCQNVIKSSDKGRGACEHSDSYVRDKIKSGPFIGKCSCAGLWEAGTAITAGGKHIANWLIGQVRDESLTNDDLKELAFKFDLKQEDLSADFKDIPLISKEKFEDISNSFFTLAKQMSTIAFQNMQQARLINKLKEADKKLYDSESLHRTTINALNSAIHVVDEGFNIVLYNSRFKEWSSKTGVATLRKGIFLKEACPKIPDSTFDEYHQVFKTGQSLISMDHFSIDNKRVVAETHKIPLIADGKVFRIITVINDISDYKNAEAALKDSEEKYRSVVNNSIEAICVIQDKKFKYFNPEMLKLFGYSESELYSLSPEETVYPDDREKVSTMRHLRLRGENVSGVYFHRIVTKTGRVRWVEIKTVTINWNKKPAVLVFLTDTTDRKEAEEGLQKAYDHLENEIIIRTEDYKKAKEEAELANSLKTKFLANISHELRTPMHHILSYSKYGMDKINKVSHDKLQHYFTQIRTSGGRLLSLLNDLLDLSKLESGEAIYEFKKADLALTVDQVITEYQHISGENKIKLEAVNRDVSSVVVCDEVKISQVLHNLMANALKFTPPGKSISIKFSEMNLPLGKRKADRHFVRSLKIEVVDAGTGIPEDELESIFDKFIQSSRTRTNAGGTGLGLSICQEIIKAHHGKIWAENNTEEGATIAFAIPYQSYSSFE